MAEAEKILKPFYERAHEAEDRLAKLEAALVNKKDSGNEELLKRVGELESKLAGEVSEREKAQKDNGKLEVENAKLRYRIMHLVREIEDKRSKLEA